LKHAVRGEISESQLELLAEAYRNGYFDVPQAVTAKELASLLGTSQSTLSEALRNAQYTLFEILFGEQ
jgi:predicted DNA binding protein